MISPAPSNTLPPPKSKTRTPTRRRPQLHVMKYSPPPTLLESPRFEVCPSNSQLSTKSLGKSSTHHSSSSRRSNRSDQSKTMGVIETEDNAATNNCMTKKRNSVRKTSAFNSHRYPSQLTEKKAGETDLTSLIVSGQDDDSTVEMVIDNNGGHNQQDLAMVTQTTNSISTTGTRKPRINNRGYASAKADIPTTRFIPLSSRRRLDSLSVQKLISTPDTRFRPAIENQHQPLPLHANISALTDSSGTSSTRTSTDSQRSTSSSPAETSLLIKFDDSPGHCSEEGNSDDSSFSSESFPSPNHGPHQHQLQMEQIEQLEESDMTLTKTSLFCYAAKAKNLSDAKKDNEKKELGKVTHNLTHLDPVWECRQSNNVGNSTIAATRNDPRRLIASLGCIIPGSSISSKSYLHSLEEDELVKSEHEAQRGCYRTKHQQSKTQSAWATKDNSLSMSLHTPSSSLSSGPSLRRSLSCTFVNPDSLQTPERPHRQHVESKNKQSIRRRLRSPNCLASPFFAVDYDDEDRKSENGIEFRTSINGTRFSSVDADRRVDLAQTSTSNGPMKSETSDEPTTVGKSKLLDRSAGISDNKNNGESPDHHVKGKRSVPNMGHSVCQSQGDCDWDEQAARISIDGTTFVGLDFNRKGDDSDNDSLNLFKQRDSSPSKLKKQENIGKRMLNSMITKFSHRKLVSSSPQESIQSPSSMTEGTGANRRVTFGVACDNDVLFFVPYFLLGVPQSELWWSREDLSRGRLEAKRTAMMLMTKLTLSRHHITDEQRKDMLSEQDVFKYNVAYGEAYRQVLTEKRLSLDRKEVLVKGLLQGYRGYEMFHPAVCIHRRNQVQGTVKSIVQYFNVINQHILNQQQHAQPTVKLTRDFSSSKFLPLMEHILEKTEHILEKTEASLHSDSMKNLPDELICALQEKAHMDMERYWKTARLVRSHSLLLSSGSRSWGQALGIMERHAVTYDVAYNDCGTAYFPLIHELKGLPYKTTTSTPSAKSEKLDGNLDSFTGIPLRKLATKKIHNRSLEVQYHEDESDEVSAYENYFVCDASDIINADSNDNDDDNSYHPQGTAVDPTNTFQQKVSRTQVAL